MADISDGSQYYWTAIVSRVGSFGHFHFIGHVYPSSRSTQCREREREIIGKLILTVRKCKLDLKVLSQWLSVRVSQVLPTNTHAREFFEDQIVILWILLRTTTKKKRHVWKCLSDSVIRVGNPPVASNMGVGGGRMIDYSCQKWYHLCYWLITVNLSNNFLNIFQNFQH